jgi:hypothetical protein
MCPLDSSEAMMEILETAVLPFQEYIYQPLQHGHIRLLEVTQDLDNYCHINHVIMLQLTPAPSHNHPAF